MVILNYHASWHLGGGVSPSGVGVIPAFGCLLSVVFNVVGVVVVAVVVVVFEVGAGNCISPISSFSSI